MSYSSVQSRQPLWAKTKVACVAIGAAVMTSACAGSGGIGGDSLAMLSSEASEKHAPKTTGTQALLEATDYWRKEYTKKPRDKKVALNYARNLKAMGQKKQALNVLQHAANLHSNNKDIASEYGRLALDLGQVSVAERLLAVADDPAKPDWRVISARGTVFAKKGQFNAALPLYQRALAIAPGETSVLNNLALAQMMNGDAKSAEALLRQAAGSASPHARKAKQNLALALGVQGKYNEAQQTASAVLPKSQAAANADYLKKLVKLAPVDVPAPKPATYAAKPAGPMTPDQIIAQAKAATLNGGKSVAPTPAKRPVKRVAKRRTQTTQSNVVRTVAKAPAANALPLKPSSF